MGDTWEERWVGETPHYAPHRSPTGPVPATPCGACGGSDTECVHAWSAGSIIGYLSELELRCRACGRFTAVEWRYES